MYYLCPVLMNLFNSLRKAIKCLASLALSLFPQTHLINLIIHEHSCKIHYVFNMICGLLAAPIRVLSYFLTLKFKGSDLCLFYLGPIITVVPLGHSLFYF